jgi:predicted nucleic acid-binding protein
VSQILDASMALAWLFIRGNVGEAELARKALSQLHLTPTIVPPLWFSEIANGVLRGERAGIVTREKASFFLDELAHANVATDFEPPASRQASVLTLARTYGLTAYDAVYLDLTLRTKGFIATFDRQLAEATRKAGARVFGDLA